MPDVPPPVPTLETETELQSKCLGPKTRTCILALLPAKADAEAELSEQATAALSSLAELSQKHSKRGDHLFPFFAIPAANSGSDSLKTALGLEKAGDIQLIAVNGKRSWWRQHDASKGYGNVAVESWVDSIRLDEGNKLKLPEGVVAEIKEEAKPSESPVEEKTETSETVAAKPAEETAEEKPPIIHEDL